MIRVPVIALFNSKLHEAITTARWLAGSGALVVVEGISIITELNPKLDFTITAARVRAVAEALICVI
jgi:hypothetical protein